jgi:hypothetical protein
MTMDDVDRVFGALDKHFSKMDAYCNGIKILEY